MDLEVFFLGGEKQGLFYFIFFSFSDHYVAGIS